MALCVYHETTEAVATCPVCKQGICAKCLDFGQDGMCGMCVEIASARKATNQANQASRAAAAAAPRPAAPAGPANAAPAGARPAGRPPAPQQRPPDGGAPKPAAGRGTGPLPPPAKPAAKPGMCAEHPDQAAKVSCTHCNKRVCPFCLDLYDLCADCRQLPQCARHESMVAPTRCAGCKMNFCKICLDGTDYCDRCRTLRQASGQPVRNTAKQGGAPPKPGAAPPKSPTQGLGRATTGNLNAKPESPAKGGTAPKPAAARSPSSKIQPGAARAALEKSSGPPWPAIAGVAVVLLIAAWKVFGGRPSLGPEEAVAALRSEMAMVQKAAVAVQKRAGAYPETSAALLDELKNEGVSVGDLPLPLKLSVGTPATEALAISYMRVGESFEIRALDHEGRPLADNGRDVVMRPPGAETDGGLRPSSRRQEPSTQPSP